MRLKYLIILFIISFSNLAFSQSGSCTEMRLDAPGGPLEGFPVKHQDGIGLCDSYAGCVVINAANFYKYGKDAFKNDCSPIALAGMLTPKINSKAHERLTVEEVIYYSNKVGSCHDGVVLEKFGGDSTKDFCQELKFAFNQLKPNKDGTAASIGQSNQEKVYCGIKLTQSQSYDSLDLVAKFLKTKADLTIVANELESVCRNHTVSVDIKDISPVRAYNHQPADRMKALKQAIDSALDANKPMPSAVKFCLHVLYDVNTNGIASDGRFDNTGCMRNGKHGRHTAPVIGRRFNKKTNSCEYLVRNSEGTSCSEYDKRLECDKTLGGRPCPAGTECGGQVWVPEKILLSNTMSAVKAEL